MVFNSLTFFVFFLCVVAMHNLPVSWRAKKRNLLVASYLFYCAWSPPLVVLIWISTVIDWFAARSMARAKSDGPRRLAMLASLSANLGLLGYFKYSEFFLGEFARFASSLGFTYQAPELDLLLPVGISFYTFQSLSYSIDVYRRKHEPWDSFLDFAFFVTFFPQLVAGPIVRAFDFLPQCREERRANARQFNWGLVLLVLGLFQKVVIADAWLAPVVDEVYGGTSFVMLDAWTATLAYSGQIFFDFSGYSTCAIGVALCLGFALPDNFAFPYAASGFSDFWRRWHITLSQWLRDYLYIPLGGNRLGALRTYINLGLTMLLGGLWHGASWNFVIWGALHGGFLAAERFIARRVTYRPPLLLSIGATYFAVCVTWVFFRAVDLDIALQILSAMFDVTSGFATSIHPTTTLSVWCIVAAMLVVHRIMRDQTLEAVVVRTPRWLVSIVVGVMVWSLLLFRGSERAFIYFQF